MTPEEQQETHPAVSVIVPTYNERSNVRPLAEEIGRALGSTRWELIFVDDSTDGTDSIVRDLAATDSRIQLLHRNRPAGGLSGAVLDGFGLARGTFCCVIDGDLQHPPAVIPDLLESAERLGCDVVIASRYRSKGDASGLQGPVRRLGSLGLKWLARAAFPTRLAGVTDPLSGFFLLRRSLAADSGLRPIGYKILLEVLVRCRWRCAGEVSYSFRPRGGGTSKSDVRQALRFLRHLGRLLWDCSPVFGPARRLVRGGANGSAGGQGRPRTPA